MHKISAANHDSFKKLLNKLPLSSEFIGSPRGIYPSTLSWSIAYQLKIGIDSQTYFPMHHKHLVTRKHPPKTIEPEISTEFKNEWQHELPETFVATIPKGRAWSDCAIISPDDKLIADVSNIYESLENHPIFQKWKLRPAFYIDGRVAALPVLSGDHNYFHWMFEVLPRLKLLQDYGIKLSEIDYFFLNKCQYSFHSETLATLGIPPEKVIECTQRTHIKARELVVPSLVCDTPSMPYWVCQFLREAFSTTKSSNTENPKRLYIGRGDAQYRRVINEAEVIDFLGRLGFKALSLSSMSVKEQAQLFASADVIIAPHGAGLTNIVFCQPGTKVIDIFVPKYIYPCYWFISNHLSLDYYYFLGNLVENQSKACPNYQKDFYINVEKLSKLLKYAEID